MCRVLTQRRMQNRFSQTWKWRLNGNFYRKSALSCGSHNEMCIDKVFSFRYRLFTLMQRRTNVTVSPWMRMKKILFLNCFLLFFSFSTSTRGENFPHSEQGKARFVSHERLEKLFLTEMMWRTRRNVIKEQFSFESDSPIIRKATTLTCSLCSTSNAVEWVLLGAFLEPFITVDLNASSPSLLPLLLLLLCGCWMMFDEDGAFDNSTLWFSVCAS